MVSRGQAQDHIEQDLAELADLAGERGGQLLGRGDQLGDAAHLGVRRRWP